MTNRHSDHRVVIVKSGGAGSALFGGVAGVLIGVGLAVALIIAACAGSCVLIMNGARQQALEAKTLDELARKDRAGHSTDAKSRSKPKLSQEQWPTLIDTRIRNDDQSAPSAITREDLAALRLRLNSQFDRDVLDEWVTDAAESPLGDTSSMRESIADRFRYLWDKSGGDKQRDEGTSRQP